jgi:hypothetical protein
MNKLNGYPLATLGVAALLGSVMATVPAHAGGGDFIEEDGACSANASWIMKAKHDDGRIELEFSVDSNRAGQTWAVRVTDNQRLVFAGEKVTNRLNQRFSVDRRPANLAGTDHFLGRARNVRTGEVCRGHVDLGRLGSSGGSG